MVHLRNFSSLIANLLLCAFMSFSFVYTLTSSLQFEYSPYRIFMYILLFLLLFTVALYNKLSILITTISSGLFIISWAANLYRTNTIFKVWDRIIALLSWLDRYIIGYETLNSQYQLFIILFLSSVISLLVYIFTSKLFNFFVILACGAGLFAAQWAFGYFVSFISFYLFLFCLIIYYFRFILKKNSLKEPNNYITPGAFTFWVLPVSALILFVSYYIPVSNKPMEWKWLTEKVNTIIEFITNSDPNSSNFEYFSVASSGFGEDSMLGGNVNLDKTLVLKVESPRIIYLRGSTRPVYTGYRWTGDKKSVKQMEDGNDVMKKEYNEMIEGMRILSGDNEYLTNYFYKDRITVTFENLRTKSLFLPSKTRSVNVTDSSDFEPYIDHYGNLTSKKTLKKNFTYSFDSYSAKYNDEKFKKAIRKSEEGFYRSLFFALERIGTFVVVGQDPSGEIVAYYQRKYNGSQNYMRMDLSKITTSMDGEQIQLNKADDATISALAETLRFEGYYVVVADKVIDQISVKDYFYHLPTSGFEIPNPIDPATPIFIRSYTEIQDLYRRLKYVSLNTAEVYADYLQLPNSLPARVKELAASVTAPFKNRYDKAKAVEHFFLENSYPYNLSPEETPRGRDFVDYFLFDSREGYCTYYASAMTVMLRSVGIPARYVEGYVLPSTPSAGSIYEVTNEQAHAWVEVYFEGYGWLPFEPTPPLSAALYETPYTPGEFSSDMNYDPYLAEYMKMLKMYGELDDESGEDLEVVSVSPATKENKTYTGIVIYLILIVLIIIFLGIIIYNFFKHRLLLFKLKKMDTRSSVLALYKYYLKIISSLGVNKKPGETASQFSERVDSTLYFYTFENFKNITEIFIVARYSNLNIEEYQRDFVYSFYEHLNGKAKDEMSDLKYFINKYLLNKL